VRLGASILPRALDRVDPEHPDFNADGVRALRRDEAARDPVRSVARELLSYWQVWRWTMDGSILRARYPELLALPGPGPALAGLAPGLAPEDIGPRRPA
jgi:hypothetical protein